ncbi:hypothetical protein ABI59_15770 [Acidobacteria bacterium Mor1]|nr:hypothetical protein ABI59_15770 [Acidobacteria bacterium Mor1]
MIHLRLVSTILSTILIGLGLPAASGVAAASLPDPDASWNRLDRDGFVLLSDARPKRVARIAAALESMNRILEVLHPQNDETAQPLTVYFFQHDRSFRPYKFLSGDRPAHIDGMFLGHRDGDFIALSGAINPARAARHEFVHHYLNRRGHRLPIWFEEGIAELYSTVRQRKHRAILGEAPPVHLSSLQQGSLIPLEEFFRLGDNPPRYFEGRIPRIFYPQSWALVHYIWLSGRFTREEIADFEQRLHLGQPAAAAFKSALGLRPREANRELRDYVDAGLPGRFRLTVEPVERDIDGVTALSRRETLYHLGNLLAHNDPGHLQSAREHLEAALELSPASLEIENALGLVALRSRRWDKAEGHFRQVLACNPSDPTARLRLGETLLHRARDLGIQSDPGDATLAQAESLLGEGIALRPADFALVALRGKTLLYRSNCDGIVDLEAARAGLPHRTDVTQDLAALLAACGRIGEARRLAHPELPADPRHHGEAGQGFRALQLYVDEDLARLRGIAGLD